MRIGFTGTKDGLTNDQLLQVHMLVGDLKTAGAWQASHGMCEGADAQFHDQVAGMGYFVVGVPGVNAAGHPYLRANVKCDLVMPERPFLIRNRVIVAESDLMIACPKETKEQWRSSGTWATIRYARKDEKPLVIIWPDGSGVVERVGPGEVTVNEFREQLEAK